MHFIFSIIIYSLSVFVHLQYYMVANNSQNVATTHHCVGHSINYRTTAIYAIFALVAIMCLLYSLGVLLFVYFRCQRRPIAGLAYVQGFFFVGFKFQICICETHVGIIIRSVGWGGGGSKQLCDLFAVCFCCVRNMGELYVQIIYISCKCASGHYFLLSFSFLILGYNILCMFLNHKISYRTKVISFKFCVC